MSHHTKKNRRWSTWTWPFQLSQTPKNTNKYCIKILYNAKKVAEINRNERSKTVSIAHKYKHITQLFHGRTLWRILVDQNVPLYDSLWAAMNSQRGTYKTLNTCLWVTELDKNFSNNKLRKMRPGGKKMIRSMQW